jgi:hypothetical protein
LLSCYLLTVPYHHSFLPPFFPSIAAAYAPCWHVVSRCALSRSSRPTAAAPHSRPVASSPPPVRAARPSRASLPLLQPTSCHPHLPAKSAVSLSTALSRSLPSFDFVSAAVEFFCIERPSISAATCADLHREHCRAVRFAAHAHATPAFASGLTRWRRQPSRRRRRTTLPYQPGSPPRCSARRAASKRRRRRRWRRPRIEVRPRRLRSASNCLIFLIFSSKYRGVRRDDAVWQFRERITNLYCAFRCGGRLLPESISAQINPSGSSAERRRADGDDARLRARLPAQVRLQPPPGELRC